MEHQKETFCYRFHAVNILTQTENGIFNSVVFCIILRNRLTSALFAGLPLLVYTRQFQHFNNKEGFG